MRKFFYMLIMAVWCTAMPVCAAVTYGIAPIGFEDGAIPTGWTQENLTGSVSWAVEGGTGVNLTYPAGAKSGEYRLAIRRPQGSGSKFVTRLISPSFDATQLANSELRFSHAQVASIGQFDTLRVYYRVSATDVWTQLAEYTSAITAWTTEAVLLPKTLQGAAYQIAFEVSDNNGYGVVLDDISVIQPSQCEAPSFGAILTTAETAYVEFVVGGTGKGSTSDLFDVVVSKAAQAEPATPVDSLVVFSAKGTADAFVNLTGLTPDTEYFVYIRTNCVDNETGYTDWVSTTFTTPVRVEVPYTENFNNVAGTGNFGTPHGWTLKTDTTTAVPFVYKGASATYKTPYSVDSTAYMAFVGSQSTSFNALPAGKYAYAATPEIHDDLSQCEVSFWGTVYDKVYNGLTDYAAELTVGVMTNPTDYSTFTPIETVHIESAYLFKKFSVSLASYTGTGKHVAFVSRSATKQNVFFIDNVSIYKPAVATPSLTVKNALPSGFEVIPSLPAGATWNLKVASTYVRDAATLTAEQCLVNLSGLTAANHTIAEEDAVLAGKTVTVYVQAVKNGVASDWSFPVTIRVPKRAILPIDMTFNTGTYAEVALSSLNNEIHSTVATAACGDLYFPLTSFSNMYPAISTITPKYDGAHLNLNGIGNYCVLPYVEGSLDTLELTFRYASYGSDYQGKLAVGVMTDPYDLSTFVTVAEYDAVSGSKYAKIICDFSSYTGAGHYVALRALAPSVASATYGSTNAIDNLSLHKVSTCRDASNLRAEAGASKAVVRWDAMGMTQWLVRLYGNSTATDTVQEHVVAQDSILLTGLTPGTTYYYAVHTICGTDTLAVEKSDMGSFTTSLGVPYKQDFGTSSSLSAVKMEGKQGLAKDVFAGTALTTTYSSNWKVGSKSVTGYVSSTGSALYLEIYTTSMKDWAILPELMLEAEPQDAIVLTFDIAMPPYSSSFENKRNSGVDDQFMVVISTDGGATWSAQNATIWNNKADSTTDYVLNDLPMTSFQTATVDLTQYKGQKIRIAFYAESTVSNADNWIIVDNIQVKAMDANCLGVTKLQAVATSDSQASITWAAGGTQSIHLMVSEAGDSTNVFEGDITDNPYTLTGLTGNTAYVVKAYQTCNPAGDTLTTSFRTQCGSFAIADLGTITFDNGAEDILCWTVGVGDTVGVGSTSLTKPYVYNSSKFGKVLYLKKPKSSYYNYGNNYYAIMPALDIDSIKHYQVVLSAATNDNDTANEAKLYVGVLSNPLQPNQYDITDTIPLQYAADSLHMRSYTLAFDDYEGDYLGNHGKYIIFLASAASNHSDVVLIDNIYLEPLSGCHQVNDMEVAVVTNASATLQWTGNAASYEVVVSDQMCSPDTLQNAVFEARNLTEKQVEVTGLSPQTTYYAYIRAICGEGDTARWSGHTIFKTACGVPYFEGFSSSSLSTDWAGYKGIFGANDTLLMKNLSESSAATSWYMTSLPSSIKGMAGTAARVEVWSTGSYDALLVSPAISLPSLEGNGEPMRVSFKVAKGTYVYSGNPSTVSNSTDDKFSLIVSTDDGQTWTRANSTIWASDGTGDYDYNTFGLTALRCNVDITKYAGQSVRLGFYTESTESSPDTYFYLDSVSVDFYTPSCDGVLNCKTLSVGTDSIALQFKATNETDVVEYVYGKDSVNVLTATGYRADANNEAVLHGLTPGSTYAIYARTLCAAGDTSAWFGPVYADTKCLLTAPCAFHFDDTDNRYAFYTSYGTDYYMENCWENLYSSYSYAPQIKNNSSSYTYSRSGNSALYFYMTSGSANTYYGYAVMPELAADMDTLMLTFWARPGYAGSSSMYSSDNSYLHSVEIGTMTNPADTATFQRIKTVEILPVSGDPVSDPMKFWRQYAVSLHGATGKYIAFRQLGGTKSNYVTIDDVEVVKQGCALVENAWVDAVKPTSAKLHWQSEAEQFVITLASGASSVQYNSTDSVMTLSGLQQGKQYTVSVASVCGTDTSVAVINTFATAYSIPFTEDFATIATAFPAAWKRYNSSYGSGITADALFAGTTSFAQKTPSTSTYEGWIYSSSYNKNAFEGSEHAYVKLSPELYEGWYDYEYYDSWYWMVSPVIDLTVVTDSAVYLSFDLALTTSSGATAPSSSANQRFYLLVSADGGTTWTKANALVWSNATADSAQYQLSGVGTGKGTHYRLNFSQYIGQNIQVAFGTYANENSNNNALHLDNIDLDVPAACLPISGCVLNALSKDSIAGVITPAEDATPTAYQYAYGAAGTDVTDMAMAATADSTFAIGGLTGGTTYDVYVRAICGAGDTSRWAGPYSAMTAFEYPFAETFDNISKGFPAGWSRNSGVSAANLFNGTASFATATTTTSGWKAGNANALEDANHVKINVYSTFSNYWLVSPVVDLSEVSDAAIMLSFDAAYTKYDKTTAPTGTATQKFYVLVSEDGGATWSKQNATLWSDAAADSAQYTMASIPTGAGANYTIDFTPYIGKQVQVAFGVAATANDNDLHLDNIAIQVAPTCHKVQNVSVTELGGYSAKVNFMSADSVAAQWQYIVCLQDSLMNPATAVTIDTTMFDLTGLQMNTGYDVYVRSICAEGDTSEWVGPKSFTTLKLYTLPFSETFDNISTAFPEDWKRYSSTSSSFAQDLFIGNTSFTAATVTTLGWGSSTYNSNAMEDANHIGVELYKGYYDDEYYYWVVTPVIDLTSTSSQLEFSFDVAYTDWGSATAPTNSGAQRFYMLVSEDGGATWRKENATLWSGAASDSANYALMEIPAGLGINYQFDFSKYAGKAIQIAFGTFANSSSPDTRLHLDNFSLDLAPTCRKVQQVSIVGITSSEATLQITPAVDSLATQWQYVLCAQGATLNPDAAVTLDTTVAVLDSLSPSTEYDVYVRSICGVGDTSAWVGPKSFATGCLVDLPVSYDFDDEDNRYVLYSSSYSSYYMENCWKSIYGSTSYVAQIKESSFGSSVYEYGREASDALYLTSSTSYPALAVMPEFNADLDTLQLVFWGRPGYAYAYSYSSTPRPYMNYAGSSYERKIEVGTMTDPNDASTFRLIKTITAEPLTSSEYPDADPEGTEYFRKYKVALKNATGKYIAFRSTGSNYFTIDNVSFEKLPDCLEPTHDAVEVLSSTKALVHWENSADSVAARLLNAAGTVLLDTTLNGDTLLLEGLSAATTYKVSLQNRCGDAVYSEWTSALTFTTAVGFPYVQNFDSLNTIEWTNAKGLLSEALAGTAPVLGSGSWSTITVTATEENLTNKAARINVYGTSKKDWYLSPMIDLTEADTAQHIGMTMTVALSYYYDHTQVVSGEQADDIFAVLVSEDGGATWTEGNVTRWDNSGSADYIYDAIPVAGQEYTILMDKYIGKTVQIALYAESTVDGGDNYLYVDDIVLDYVDFNCMGIQNLQIVPGTTRADLSWHTVGNDTVQIVLTDTLSKQVMVSTITTDSVFSCTTLQPNTVYSLSIRQVCGDEPMTALFRTVIAVPYLQDFEDISAWTKGSGLLAKVLTGTASITASTYGGWSTATAMATEANLSGKVVRNNVFGTGKSDWFISPLIDLTETDSALYLAMKLKVALHTYSGGNSVTPGQQEDDIFAVVISEDAGATWTTGNVTRWDNSDSADYVYDEIPVAGQEYLVLLNQYVGKKIKVALYAESTVTNGDNYLYVDDVEIDYVDASCLGVNHLKADSVSVDGVWTSWQTIGNDTVVLTLADMNGNIVYTTTTADTEFSYTGLKSNTAYRLTVQQACGSLPQSVVFKTSITIPYLETFTIQPSDWTKDYGVLSDIVAGGKFGTEGLTSSAYYASVMPWLWDNSKRTDAEVNIDSASAYINVYHYYDYDYDGYDEEYMTASWYISPVINIPELDATKSLSLSLVAALSNYESHSKVDSTKQQNCKFAVVISEDAGATWSMNNATLWDNQGEGKYVYNDIPVAGATYSIDMEQYAGKSVKVALYAEALSGTADNNLFVDNVAIKMVEKVNYAAAQCNSADYHDEFFTIPYDSLVIGTTEYTTRRNGQENAADTIYTLSLTVYPAVQTVIYDTICQGYRYTANGFDEEVLQSTMLSMRTTSSNGCDSMVTVYVEVLPTVYSDTTIYACTEYTLNGTTYYSNQVLMDTLVSATGCDSISRIFLRISPEASYETEWRTAICAGSSFSDEVFTDLTESGTYVDTVSTRFGCDSIVTLHLLVADASMNAYDTIELEDLPYIYEGDTILSGAAQKGNVYKHDVHADCGTVTLNVYIKDEEMGISNVEIGSLTIAPNPVHAGEDIRLMNTFRPADDYVLTVHDALGQAVYTTHTAESQIPGISVSGYYVVRVVNNGQVFQAKLLVQ